MRKGPSWFNIASIGLGLAFLYLPIAILVIYSFNASRLVTVWAGWSTRWYAELLQDQAMLDAAWTSLRVALLSATVATVLGTLAALSLVRMGRFRGRLLFSAMIYAPLILPEVITGLSLLLLFVAVAIDRGFWTIVIAHTTLTMGFVTVIVQARLLGFDRSIEEAAMDLGAPPVKTFFADYLAYYCAGGGCRLDARLHALARRPGNRQLHHRSRRYHAADPDLFRGAARGEAGDQCHLHDHDRRGRRHRRRGVTAVEAAGSQNGDARAGCGVMLDRYSLLGPGGRNR